MSRGALAQRLSSMPQPATPIQTSNSDRRRPRPLPATGLPAARENRRGWTVLSALLHVLIVMLLVTDMTSHTGVVIEREQGAGGAGPAGGGGGGRRGTGGVREHVRFVQTTPPPPTPVATPVVIPPVVQPPVPQPVIPPPQIVKAPEPVPEAKIEAKVEPAKIEATAPIPGTGGGTGRDGSAGNGPGSGGGVGSGIGTGRGSGIGPGTGGGTQANFPPTAIELFIPPLPMPGKVRGFHLVAEFDVDSTGKVLDYVFNPTPDGGYNKRLSEVLKSTRFRPGTTPGGAPVRMKAQIIYDF
jgi:protein TonB